MGPTARSIFKRLQQHCVEYILLHIDDKEDVMVKIFKNLAKRYGGDEVLRVFDMKGSLDFSTVSHAIIESIHEHMKRVNKYLEDLTGAKDRCMIL